MARTKEVMDVWLDSGAMPFAAGLHYPFENKAWVDGKGYPADLYFRSLLSTVDPRRWF